LFGLLTQRIFEFVLVLTGISIDAFSEIPGTNTLVDYAHIHVGQNITPCMLLPHELESQEGSKQ
jgi:hypothetical protein